MSGFLRVAVNAPSVNDYRPLKANFISWGTRSCAGFEDGTEVPSNLLVVNTGIPEILIAKYRLRTAFPSLKYTVEFLVTSCSCVCDS